MSYGLIGMGRQNADQAVAGMQQVSQQEQQRNQQNAAQKLQAEMTKKGNQMSAAGMGASVGMMAGMGSAAMGAKFGMAAGPVGMLAGAALGYVFGSLF